MTALLDTRKRIKMELIKFNYTKKEGRKEAELDEPGVYTQQKILQVRLNPEWKSDLRVKTS
jgi:hypothetical protein